MEETKMFPRNPVPHTFLTIVIALCLLSSACSPEQKRVMTKQEVAAVLAEIDAAVKRKDVGAMLKHFSKDARIKVNVEDPDATIRGMVFTREQYRDYFQGAFNLIDEYQYDRRDTVINLAPDGQSAIVADQVFEEVKTGGETINSVTVETATLKMEDGRVVITSLEGTLRWTVPQKTRSRSRRS
jgi:ketosteroid isomerase-like protein